LLLLARAHLESGDIDPARVALERARERSEQATVGSPSPRRQARRQLPFQAARAELALLEGNAELALQRSVELLTAAPAVEAPKYTALGHWLAARAQL